MNYYDDWSPVISWTSVEMALCSVLHKLKLKPAKHCVAIKHELFQVFKGKKGL